METQFERNRLSVAEAIGKMSDAELDEALAEGKRNGLFQTFVEGRQVLANPEAPAKPSIRLVGISA